MGPVPRTSLIVVINNHDDKDILYSGLAPGLVGVWQLNLRVPETVPPGNRILVVISFRDIASNNPQNILQIVTTIAVQ
jgi:uncharacterized protein (TIGR03437 family)